MVWSLLSRSVRKFAMVQPLVPTESLKFTEARPIISNLLDRVFRREVGVRIFKGSAPVAAIVSIRDLERLEKYDRERAERFRALESQAEKFADLLMCHHLNSKSRSPMPSP
jgi:prevent-host-death family protein